MYTRKTGGIQRGGVLKAIHPIQVQLFKLGLSSARVSPGGCQQPQVSLATQEMELTCNLHIWDSLTNKLLLCICHLEILKRQNQLIKSASKRPKLDMIWQEYQKGESHVARIMI